MHNLPSSLSRTSSSASFSSSDDITPSAINASRRTRKRFTNTQLTMLENLFHQTSHPSRDEREAVAKAGQMEIKSVTIWFQNKRQTERKATANKDGSSPRTVSPSFSSSTVSSKTSSSLTARPTLDRIATRTEMRNHHAPRTPRRHAPANPNGPDAIWDHMPSSPLVPASPAASEYLNYGRTTKSKRTLEWACAAARATDKEQYQQQQKQPQHSHHHHHAPPSQHHGHSTHPHSSGVASSSVVGRRTVHRERPQANYHPDVTPKGAPMDLDVTEDESEEALTPPGSWGSGNQWDGKLPHSIDGSKKSLPSVVEDDDMMKAALALCGLGGGGRFSGHF